MITNRKLLKEYIYLDRKRYNYSLSNYIRSTLLFQDRAHAIRLLRRLRITEYLFSKKENPFFFVLYLFSYLRYNYLQYKYDTYVGLNMVGPGLWIPHMGGG